MWGGSKLIGSGGWGSVRAVGEGVGVWVGEPFGGNHDDNPRFEDPFRKPFLGANHDYVGRQHADREWGVGVGASRR